MTSRLLKNHPTMSSRAQRGICFYLPLSKAQADSSARQRASGFRMTSSRIFQRPPRLIRRKSVAGFTLLELLVSMTILSLLATTILFGWRIAISAWQKASDHLERSRTVLEANQLLERQIASMLPYRTSTVKAGQVLFFQGEPRTARFLSRYSLTGRSSSGLYRIEYQIADMTAGGKELLMNEFPVQSDQELASLFSLPDPASTVKMLQFVSFERGPQTVVLLTGLQDCRFEYFKPAFANEAAHWTDQWAGPSTELPRAMAIRVALPESPSELQPSSVVAEIRNFSPPVVAER